MTTPITRQYKRGQIRQEDGATLIIVLILITVIAVVLGVVLTEVGTATKSTVAYSDETSSSYAADAAGKAAITQLINGKVPNLCATTTGDPFTLGGGIPFYPASGSSSTSYNAAVTCTPDPNSAGIGGVIGGGNKPAYALLTLGESNLETGQTFGQANKDINVLNGNVASNSTIDSSHANLIVNSPYTIKAMVTPCDGVICGALGAPVPDPVARYVAPSGSVVAAPAPICSPNGNAVAFRPGLYTNASVLNAGCWDSNAVVWFSPGNYFFDFAGSWTVPQRVVAGTPMNNAATSVPITGLDPTNGATLSALSSVHASPGGCASPTKFNLPGVEFFFGGTSQMDMNTADLEACANFQTTQSNKVPTVIYGLRNPYTNGGTISAQAGCILAVNGCTMMTSNGNGQAELHLNGALYAPLAYIDATYKNSAGQSFNWGVVARRFSGTTVGTTPTDPFIQLPADGTFGLAAYSIVYLSIYTCPAPAACSTSGTPTLRAKIKLAGSTAPLTATVLSWNNLR